MIDEDAPPAVASPYADRVKGWCPGALRPMASGDGLVVRLRLPCGIVPRAVADWAEAYGNGAIDLSARGHLQLRGVSEATLPALTKDLETAGLLDASPQAEAVRNVLVSPFAGLDPAAPFDVRPHAQDLERELAVNPALWALPGKFGFSFDAGARPLGDANADVAFVAQAPDAFVVHLAGAPALGPFPAAESTRIAVALALAFLRLPDAPRRMREAVRRHGLAPFAQAADLRATAVTPRPRRPAADWIGAHALGPAAFAGLGLPFGRMGAAELRALAKTELRLTPWRALIAPAPDLAAARRLIEATPGLIADPADPRLETAACPGAPECSSAQGETRALAARLARPGLHVSGCLKGCAHPAPAPLTVVATAQGYDLIRNGRADAAPFARGLSADALEELL
jgi:precorrin-3B synthase